jgi:ABC-type multidrug transport system ATPase subunit
MALLAVEGLSCRYGSIRAIRDIDLTVGEGEIVGLIGANGAGKTTTLNGIAGLVPPSGGRVRLADRDVTASARTACSGPAWPSSPSGGGSSST